MAKAKIAITNWTPEALGDLSAQGSWRHVLRCPFPAGSQPAHRWWDARELAMGIRQGRYTTNAGENERKVKRFHYDTDSREDVA